MNKFHSGIITYKNRSAITDLDVDDYEFLLKKAESVTKTNIVSGFVKVTMFPNDGNIFNFDLSQWKLSIKQEIVPDWFCLSTARKLMGQSLEELFRKRFYVNRKNLAQSDDQRIFIKNSNVQTYKHSTVWAYGNSVIESYDQSLIWAYDCSTIVAHDFSVVRACDCSVVEADDNARVYAYSNCTVSVYGAAIANRMSTTVTIKGIGEAGIIRDYSRKKPVLVYAQDGAFNAEAWSKRK